MKVFISEPFPGDDKCPFCEKHYTKSRKVHLTGPVADVFIILCEACYQKLKEGINNVD